MIENDVWIGYNVTIMPGIKVGDGRILATNSTVTRDVEPYTIVGGNPAKTLKKRFSEEKIDLLKKIKWWDWAEEKISRHVGDLTGNDIERLREIN